MKTFVLALCALQASAVNVVRTRDHLESVSIAQARVSVALDALFTSIASVEVALSNSVRESHLKAISGNTAFVAAEPAEPADEDADGPSYDIEDSPEALQQALASGVAELEAMMAEQFPDQAAIEAKAAELDHLYAQAEFHTEAADALAAQLASLESLIAQSHIMDPQADLEAAISHLEGQIMNYSDYLKDNNPRAGYDPIADAKGHKETLQSTHDDHTAYNTAQNPSAMDPNAAVAQMSSDLAGAIAEHEASMANWTEAQNQAVQDMGTLDDHQAVLDTLDDAPDADAELLKLRSQAAAAENLELLFLAAKSLASNL
jgi:hypothetical protein